MSDLTDKQIAGGDMNDTEKMIWAQVYASRYDAAVGNPPGYVVRAGDAGWEEWEQDIAANASEHACGAVQRFRSLGPRLEEGFEKDSDVYQMWAALAAVEGRW